jgi:hypothetical protein
MRLELKMRKYISPLGDRFFVWVFEKCEVARFEGIILSDVTSEKLFVVVLLEALELVRSIDPRRFSRIRRHIRFIANFSPGYSGACYDSQTRSCKFLFKGPSQDDPDRMAFVVGYAKVLVHESTHGEILARRIPYTPALRARVERLCVKEENRFVAALKRTRPEIGDRFWTEFDEGFWDPVWELTFFQKLRNVVSFKL